MAAVIVVAGYTRIYTGASLIGETDADNAIKLHIATPKKKVHTNLSGPEMFEVLLNLGITGILTIPLIKWDQAVLTTILGNGGASEGQQGTLGASEASFPLTITPTNGKTIPFPKCWKVDGYDLEKFGYEPTQFLLAVYTQPDPTFLMNASNPMYSYV